MKTITFGFSTRNNNLLSLVIRTMEDRKFSHVYLKTRDDYTGRDYIFQATIPNVTLTNPDIFATVDQSVAEIAIPVSDAEHLACCQFFLENTGKTYATAKLFGILWKRLIKDWFGKTIKAPTSNDHKTEECSEAGAMVLKILGLETNEDLESVGPGWVYDKALEMANARKAK